ncbi:hypothetical protein SanaruYs_12310 [Chryseotalea sanaruensis]|uniref:DUF4252 domain-containing protein n=2 Tax=Chryseotalea sanaruensis TaxID=2482724 RepID=A0A401U7Z2_9BACT|nr:hypothetical protein SanaruYs_12310 [Chryseotalea sanaruensis]
MNMKKLLTLILLTCATTVFAQFDTHLATAKAEYAKGNLEASRFAMQQLMTELDVQIGKEVLALLPTKMDALNANIINDNVTANTGLAGCLIHREYGSQEKEARIEIMSNSPLVASLNAILAMPFMGNSGDGSQKVVKIGGYKSILQKSVDSETNVENYTLQIPMNSTLLTLYADKSNETEVLKWANTIPVDKIAKMVQ